MKRRIETALTILKKYQNSNYEYLGEGFSGVVFHDEKYVYKVHIPLAKMNYGEMDGLLNLIGMINAFKHSKHFYPIEIVNVDDVFIIKYPYECDEGIVRIEEDEFISFLAEMWDKKIICKNINKEKNFIRTKGTLKFIDYEVLQYSDNLFLNIAAEAYMYLKYPGMKEIEYNKLKRSIINNFTHKMIDDFKNFLKKVFISVTFPECLKLINNDPQMDNNVCCIENINEKIIWNTIMKDKFIEYYKVNTFFRNYDVDLELVPKFINLNDSNKKITLLIKACAQDCSTLYTQVHHILHQLSSPDIFLEKVIVVDKKENDFLRQYTSEGSLKELYDVIDMLIEEGMIDYWITIPEEKVEEVNYRWFGIRTNQTHTIDNIPVTPQVYGFEVVRGDYILQMDCDVLIGREDFNHSFIMDMISALDSNENAVSVGFNIYKNKKKRFIPFHAPSGGYKPEVRFSLIHKNRLLKLRPLPNKLVDGKLKWGWYHALHEFQKKSDIVSLRGGDRRSFYIHPQNYRKTCKTTWFIIMDRIEKGFIPKVQEENFDLAGTFFDWAIPKRREKIVVLAIIDKSTDVKRFFRFYESIKRQNMKDIGIIIVNTDPDYAKDKIIWSGIRDDRNVTYVHTKIQITNMEAIYISVHYFIPNLDTYILLANPNDFFVGKNSIAEIFERLRMYKGDVLIGKPLDQELLKNAGYYYIDFTNTKELESNLHRYPKVFKKLLFEMIGQHTLKKMFKKNMDVKYAWFEDVESTYLFSLLVENAENPLRFDFINYFVDREICEDEVKISYSILKNNTKQISLRKINGGRIDFIPNLNQVEIDITYDCNLRCEACNRSCAQAPSKEDYMTLTQIKKFIEESLRLEKKWKRINILGGEPTLHPDFLKIVGLVYEDYIIQYSPDTILQITSNGYSQETIEILETLPKLRNIFIDEPSFKRSNKIPHFIQFNISPIDLDEYQNSDFSTGCWMTSYCGIGLNKYGYYPCGVACGLDRVLGLDIGIKSLEEVTIERLKELLDVLCRYCGNFVEYAENRGDFLPRCERRPFEKQKMSKTWEEIYKNYHENKPKLTSIYEEGD